MGGSVWWSRDVGRSGSVLREPQWLALERKPAVQTGGKSLEAPRALRLACDPLNAHAPSLRACPRAFEAQGSADGVSWHTLGSWRGLTPQDFGAACGALFQLAPGAGCSNASGAGGAGGAGAGGAPFCGAPRRNCEEFPRNGKRCREAVCNEGASCAAAMHDYGFDCSCTCLTPLDKPPTCVQVRRAPPPPPDSSQLPGTCSERVSRVCRALILGVNAFGHAFAF